MKLSMKPSSLIAAAMIAVASPGVYAHTEHGQPQYDGIYGEAGTFQLELVVKEHEVVLYATVHGEPLSTKGASGKLIILNADGKTEVDLKPAGDNKLVAKLKAKPVSGSKIVANVTMAGKGPANIRYSIE